MTVLQISILPAGPGTRPSAPPWVADAGAIVTFESDRPTLRPEQPLLRQDAFGDELTHTLIAGRYQVEKLLGRGGTSMVYAVLDRRTGQRRALKRVLPSLARDPVSAQLIAREAETAAQITTDAALRVYDTGTDRGCAYLVSELLQGESLAERIQRGPIFVREALQIMTALARAVGEIHRSGVIHRDIKPENVFLCTAPRDTWRIKLIDLGIARGAPIPGRNSLTSGSMFIGTPYYCSPEHLSTPRDADERTDIYSLGVVLYELLTGHLPHQGDTLTALLLNILRVEPRPMAAFVDHVPVHVERIAMRAMSRDPQARHASADQLADALRGALCAL